MIRYRKTKSRQWLKVGTWLLLLWASWVLLWGVLGLVFGLLVPSSSTDTDAGKQTPDNITQSSNLALYQNETTTQPEFRFITLNDTNSVSGFLCCVKMNERLYPVVDKKMNASGMYMGAVCFELMATDVETLSYFNSSRCTERRIGKAFANDKSGETQIDVETEKPTQGLNNQTGGGSNIVDGVNLSSCVSYYYYKNGVIVISSHAAMSKFNVPRGSVATIAMLRNVTDDNEPLCVTTLNETTLNCIVSSAIEKRGYTLTYGITGRGVILNDDYNVVDCVKNCTTITTSRLKEGIGQPYTDNERHYDTLECW